jgi:hypothetical protein
MDLETAMTLWKELGGTLVSWSKEDGYYSLFVKDREVQGHIKAHSGGMSWCLPDELIEYRENKLTEKV